MTTRLEARGNTLTGYAAVWYSPSQVLTEKGRTFVETVARGAFTRSLAAPPRGDIVALWQHAAGRPPLGRLSAGTLRLVEDATGLRFEIDAPGWAADIVESVRRGDVNGMSSGADIAAGGQSWTHAGGLPQRRLTALDLFEISAVIDSAYSATSVVVRHRAGVVVPDPAPTPDPARSRRNRRLLQLAGLDTGNAPPHTPGE